ncbi:MAG: hypothetical protein JST04_17935 [Bdellovibrionales bacterium]|nr:hypothetical protein [Bdellovibrionales bacterium]
MKSSRFAVFFVLILVPFPAFAAKKSAATKTVAPGEEDPGRGSSLSLEYDHSPGDLSTVLFNGDIGLTKKLGFLMNYRYDELPEGYAMGHAWNAGGGFAYDFDDVYSANAGGEYQRLLGNIYAPGGSVGVHANVERWRFGLSFRSLKYQTDHARITSLGGTTTQRSLGIEVSYKLNDAWKIRGSYVGYHYTGVTPEQFGTLFASAPNALPGVQDTVDGFPRSTGSLGVLLLASDRWDFDLTFSRTRYVLIPNSSSVSLGANYQATDAWGFGPILTGLRQDNHRTGTVLGVQTSYFWD